MEWIEQQQQQQLLGYTKKKKKKKKKKFSTPFFLFKKRKTGKTHPSVGTGEIQYELSNKISPLRIHHYWIHRYAIAFFTRTQQQLYTMVVEIHDHFVARHPRFNPQNVCVHHMSPYVCSSFADIHPYIHDMTCWM
jgi:hypothetical protein